MATATSEGAPTPNAAQPASRQGPARWRRPGSSVAELADDWANSGLADDWANSGLADDWAAGVDRFKSGSPAPRRARGPRRSGASGAGSAGSCGSAAGCDKRISASACMLSILARRRGSQDSIADLFLPQRQLLHNPSTFATS